MFSICTKNKHPLILLLCTYVLECIISGFTSCCGDDNDSIIIKLKDWQIENKLGDLENSLLINFQ